MQKTMEVNYLKHNEYGYMTIVLPDTKLHESDSYTLLGSGYAEIELLDQNEVAATEVEKLRAIKQKTLAGQALVIERIEDRIQSLLAIGHDGSAS